MRLLKFLNFNGIVMIAFLFCFGACKKTNEEKKEINYIPYYLKVYEADSLYLSGNYKRSFEILDSLFRFYEPLNQLEYYEITTYIKSSYLVGSNQNLKPYFKRLVKDWGYNENQIKNSYDKILSQAFEKAPLSNKEFEELKQLYKNNVNWRLRSTIVKILEDDQLFRGKDRGKEYMREDSVDLVHIELLKDIFKKYGYPDYKSIGYPKYGEMVDLMVVFNHISDNLSESDYVFFHNELLTFIKNGTASPMCMAFLVDKRSFDKDRSTVYGTYLESEVTKFDTTEINKNRKSIGLPSIQYEKFKEKVYDSMFNQ